ncbi:GntR family transcriptional regulator [Labrenzia sp. OB1]|uniref:GntR family transcriptional regulator n=1 Tax=Labrenzia sp. OB1 TaxID=1561204 RepID=UPI0007B1C239|nr:GntR family transcriptional regulator [Labrenzia sp. OB1]KZM48570.1 GntR family transcriptional regulator [Labrenzia sp. OB1]
MPDRKDARHLHDLFQVPPGRTLDICLKIHGAILEHRLAPGTKLSEDEVGEIYGASRTVVRAALQALAHTGLVTIEKNRGAFVAKPSIREAHEIFEARALIEPRVARMTAKSITEKDLDRLQAHIDAEHQALHDGDMGKALFLSGAFHTTIADIADQQVLARMVRSLISRSSLIIAMYWQRADTACESHSHHALMKAFAEHDSDAAEDIQKSHLIDLHSGLNLVEVRQQHDSLKDILRTG